MLTYCRYRHRIESGRSVGRSPPEPPTPTLRPLTTHLTLPYTHHQPSSILILLSKTSLSFPPASPPVYRLHPPVFRLPILFLHPARSPQNPPALLPPTYLPYLVMSTHPHSSPKKMKKNIALYTTPTHDLYLGPASPNLESVVNGHDNAKVDGEEPREGEGLREGEVCVAVRRTGICGFVFISLPFHFRRLLGVAGLGSGMGGYFRRELSDNSPNHPAI